LHAATCRDYVRYALTQCASVTLAASFASPARRIRFETGL
jgi:hypothetical protein